MNLNSKPGNPHNKQFRILTNPNGGPLTWPQIEAAREQIDGKRVRVVYDTGRAIEDVVEFRPANHLGTKCFAGLYLLDGIRALAADGIGGGNPLSIEVLEPEAARLREAAEGAP